MMTDLGTGIYLDGSFDFEADSTGDIRATEGVRELQKDLAFQMVISLTKYLGQPPSGNLQEKVAGTAKRVAETDDRVDFVDSRKTEVSFDSARQEITLKITVQTEEGLQDLIFDI
jgi:hypothetical protein